MLGDILKMIFYTGILYGVIGTLMIEGLIIVAYHLIGKKGRDGEQR